MKTKTFLMAAVAMAAVLVFGGESFARGGGGAGGGARVNGGGQGTQLRDGSGDMNRVKAQKRVQTQERDRKSVV